MKTKKKVWMSSKQIKDLVSLYPDILREAEQVTSKDHSIKHPITMDDVRKEQSLNIAKQSGLIMALQRRFGNITDFKF